MSGGNHRDAILRRRPAGAVPALEWAGSSEPLVPVIFQGTGVCRVAGRESQQVYCFTSNDPEQIIDARDAEALLRTGLFRVAGGAGLR